ARRRLGPDDLVHLADAVGGLAVGEALARAGAVLLEELLPERPPARTPLAPHSIAICTWRLYCGKSTPALSSTHGRSLAALSFLRLSSSWLSLSLPRVPGNSAL